MPENKNAVKLNKEETVNLVASVNKVIFQWIISEPFNSLNNARLFNFNTVEMDGNSGVLLYIKNEGLFVYMSNTDGTPPTADNINIFTVTPSGAPSAIGVIARVVNAYGALIETNSANMNVESIPIGSVFYVNDLMRFYGKYTNSRSFPLQTTFTIGPDGQYSTINDAITDILSVGTYSSVTLEIIGNIVETVPTTFNSFFDLTIKSNAEYVIFWSNAGLSWGIEGGNCRMIGNFTNIINLDSRQYFIYCDPNSTFFNLEISCNNFLQDTGASLDFYYLIWADIPDANNRITGGVHGLFSPQSMMALGYSLRISNAVILISGGDGTIINLNDTLIMSECVFVISNEQGSGRITIESSLNLQFNEILFRQGGAVTGRSFTFSSGTIIGENCNNTIPSFEVQVSTNELMLSNSKNLSPAFTTPTPVGSKCMVSNCDIDKIYELGIFSVQHYTNCILPTQIYGNNNNRYIINGCSFKGIATFISSNNIVNGCYNDISYFNISGDNSIFTSNQTTGPISNIGTGNVLANNVVI